MTRQAVNIGIPTLHCYDKLVRLCTALAHDKHKGIEARVTVIDNGRKLFSGPWAEQLTSLPLPIRYVIPPSNLGVAASWNWLLRSLGRCIIANDDTVFSLDDAKAFLDAARLSPETIVFNTSAPCNAWSVFFVNRPDKWLNMGGFDEAFFPAYFEDNDAYWRLELAGFPCKLVALKDWQHDQSSTLVEGDAEYQRNHQLSFGRNADYYRRKWGGSPGNEKFAVPFNGLAA
jgi:GT2 family glycosyltransferase